MAPPPMQQVINLFRRLLPKYLDQKTLLDTEVLKKCIRDIVGDLTFQEAFEKTGRIINISVTPQYYTSAAKRYGLVSLL